jgi:dienelactone hydrolase
MKTCRAAPGLLVLLALVVSAGEAPLDTALRAPPDPVVVAAATSAAEAGGTGPYKATMVAEPSLTTHTVYRPRDLAAWGANRKLPIVVWANGACVNVGNRFRYFLTEIASHGYFAVAIGPIGPQYLEGQSSMNAPGTPVRATPPPIARVQATKSEQLIDAMDWAVAQSKDRSSPYFGKIDTGRIAVMGQSCGGLQALVASADPRTTTSVIWNSGAFPPGAPALIGAEATKESLQKLHAPVAYFSGDTRDIAYVNTEDDYSRINQVPIFRAYQKGMGHIATYRTPNGGSYGQVAVAWLDWQLKGLPAAAAWFKGSACKLCKDPEWVVRKKRI